MASPILVLLGLAIFAPLVIAYFLAVATALIRAMRAGRADLHDDGELDVH